MTFPAIPMLAQRSGDNLNGLVAMQLIGFPVGGCVFLLNTQAKWQFCNPRARLLPGYAGSHLVMLAFILIAFVGILPLVAGQLGVNPLGAMACAVTLAAPFLWASHANWPLANMAAIALFFSLYNHSVAAFWLSPDGAARWFPLHLALLAAGWIAVVAWLWRLTRLREDAPDYGLPLDALVGSATRIERTQASRAAMLQLLRSPPTRWLCDRWHNRLVGIRAGVPDARRRLLRYGFGATPVAAAALWMSLIFFATLWIMSQTEVFQRGDAPAAVLPALNIMMIMPAMTAFGMLAMRRPRMPQELLLPLTRTQYIDGLLVALGRSVGIAWITVHASLLALLAVIAPGLLTWQFVGALTALSLSSQLYAFGVVTRVTQIPQGGKRLVMLMVGLIPAMVAMAVSLGVLPDGATGLIVAWAAVAALTAAGAVVILYSRRRWLELELA